MKNDYEITAKQHPCVLFFFGHNTLVKYPKHTKRKRQKNNGRKPLVIRGARQVGKTWLVREFARQNFDKTPKKSSLFQGGDIDRCLQMLALDADMEIRPGNTLIFLDEIQAAPELLPLLRYFFEERPTVGK